MINTLFVCCVLLVCGVETTPTPLLSFPVHDGPTATPAPVPLGTMDTESILVAPETVTMERILETPSQAEISALEEMERKSETTNIFRAVADYSRDESSKKVTIVIKAFERAGCVVSLVNSITRRYPRIKILIGDDSRVLPLSLTSVLENSHVTYYHLPFNCGVAAARNFLIRQVTTPFVLVIDDDLIFTDHTRLEPLLADLESSGADVVGGCVDDNDKECSGDHDMFYKDRLPTAGSLEENAFSTVQIDANDHNAMDIVLQRDGTNNLTHTPFCKESDMVSRMFLGRTAFFLSVRWDPFFKIGNEEFFYRAKKSHAYIRFCTSSIVLHKGDACVPDRDQRERYERFASIGRWATFLEYFFVKHEPVTVLELPIGTIRWRCGCDRMDVASSGRYNCSNPINERTDCDAVTDFLPLREGQHRIVDDVEANVPYPINQGPTIMDRHFMDSQPVELDLTSDPTEHTDFMEPQKA